MSSSTSFFDGDTHRSSTGCSGGVTSTIFPQDAAGKGILQKGHIGTPDWDPQVIGFHQCFHRNNNHTDHCPAPLLR